MFIKSKYDNNNIVDAGGYYDAAHMLAISDINVDDCKDYINTQVGDIDDTKVATSDYDKDLAMRHNGLVTGITYNNTTNKCFLLGEGCLSNLDSSNPGYSTYYDSSIVNVLTGDDDTCSTLNSKFTTPIAGARITMKKNTNMIPSRGYPEIKDVNLNDCVSNLGYANADIDGVVSAVQLTSDPEYIKNYTQSEQDAKQVCLLFPSSEDYSWTPDSNSTVYYDNVYNTPIPQVSSSPPGPSPPGPPEYTQLQAFIFLLIGFIVLIGLAFLIHRRKHRAKKGSHAKESGHNRDSDYDDNDYDDNDYGDNDYAYDSNKFSNTYK